MALDHGLHLTDRRGAVVLKLEGDVDERSEEEILQAVAAALTFEPSRLELDLSAVTFLGSRGLSILLLARRIAAKHHARVAVIHAPPIVRRVIEIAALDQVFELAP